VKVLFSLWQILAGTGLGVAGKGKRRKSGEDNLGMFMKTVGLSINKSRH